LILVDTSVWIDHLRRGDARLAALLERGEVATHPFVIGELACGSLKERPVILQLLKQLPPAVVADHEEVLRLVERHRLHGRGIGYVDVHLLAAASLTHGARLWTRDRRLHRLAAELGLTPRDPGVQ
jgi:predicted nucleic acid-binding protein